MACLTLLLSGVLTFIVVTVHSINTEDSLKLQTNIIPEHYDIQLTLHIEENVFVGYNHYYIEILAKTQTISMLSEELGIGLAKMNIYHKYNAWPISSLDYTVVEYTYDKENHTVSLIFKEEIPPGKYTLIVKYSGVIDDKLDDESAKGGFRRVSITEEEGVMWLSATHFNPIWARRIFPCWDPSKKATFEIFVEHPKEYTILSNMPMQLNEHESNNNIRHTKFDSTPAMSPYHVSIVITNFVRNFIFENDIVSMWCKMQSSSSVQFALTVTRNITLYLKEEWKHLQQFPNVNYIVMPGFQELDKSVANLGIIIYNEADIIYNERRDTIGHKYNLIRLIGHEVIREWFESIANPFWWPKSANPFCLSNGFVTFFATHTLNQTFPNSRIIDLFVVQIQHESLDFDIDDKMLVHTYGGDTSSAHLVEIANRIKASVILRMLQHAFNIKAFWLGISTYLYEKKYHADNFWEAIKIAHDKIDPGTFNIKEMMHPWIMQKGYPVLNVTRPYRAFSDIIHISIENLNIPNENRWIPVTYTTETYINFNNTTPRIWLHPPHNHRFIYPMNNREDGWVILNIQQTGYYRVNYDDENWRKIAVYLNSENYWKIHVLNRAQIIDDAFHFLLLGKLKPDTFWELTKYLSRETDYIAWYPMFKAIECISSVFSLPEMGVHYIKEKLSDMLNYLLQNIKYKEKPTDDDFTKALRQEAVQWACILEQPNCLEMANNQLKQHLKYSTKLSPWWKKWTYCYGLATEDTITWFKILNIIRGVNDRIVYFLTCSNQINLNEINKYILTYLSYTQYFKTSYTQDDADDFNYYNYMVPKHNTYNTRSNITNNTIAQYAIRHFLFTVVNYTKNDKTFKTLLEDFANIKPREVDMPAALLILINHIYSKQQLDQVYDSFQNFDKHQIYQMKNRIGTRASQIDDHILLLKRIQPINRSCTKL